MSTHTIYTIGHSNQPAADLIALLDQHQIAVLIDVRSAPYSRYSPQFNREALRDTLSRAGIRYVFAGEYLGGRPADPACYDDLGHVDYQRIARQAFYVTGIDRLIDYACAARTAIMCSEEDPNQCHRHKLIAQTLLSRGFTVLHIRGDGRIEPARPLAVQARLFG
ncbi:DUF488 family protein [Sphaerobacter thermophilus]|jgi:uncharacterized protein (DUF488 family)|uniref:DUF488 domain-containing protein n=1 Tax=Sphaerobacter thermophilus (strain ATCC 49802 / DSM 20745 / KCCM 41009 / NCIMB 13125 / S 6022) TaxID=479434 RepID=D1C4U4_SPHTD|nr:DUF488 domain-containing protein [Sphaerobacter thermophilus]ACZ39261.1 protein of unknown function DUF1130 [Sphaerobacter thermophilus DSM 20745]